MRHTAQRARRWVLRELARLTERRPTQAEGATRPPSPDGEPGADTAGGGDVGAQTLRGGRPQTAGE